MEVSDDMTASPPGSQPGPDAELEAEEARLWRTLKVHGGAGARERLFDLHLSFARKIAARHYHRGQAGAVEFPDVSQWAVAGLLEAIDQFEVDRGVPFRGFAARRISGSILDGVAQTSEVRGQISYRSRVRRERVRSLAPDRAALLGRDEALDKLVSLAVGLAMGFMLESAGVHMDGEPVDQSANAYDSLSWKDTIRRMHAEIDHLPEREQKIIRHHYINGLTFERIAQLLQLSKGRVSQLHRAALATLRLRIGRDGNFRLER